MTLRGDDELADELRAILAAEGPSAPVVFDADPARLQGGLSADLFTFRLRSGPPDLVGLDLVLRVAPPSACPMGECVIQRTLADLGFSVPNVYRVGTSNHDETYMVMQRVAGRPLFEALGPRRAFAAAPVQLAALMYELHAIDPTPVRDALTRSGCEEQLDGTVRALREVEHWCEHLEQRGTGLRRWLDDHLPIGRPQVVCHSDLHALNVLVDGDRRSLIDWEMATLAPPEFDLARTKVLFRSIPMPLPAGTRPILSRMGRTSASAFERAYAQHRAVSTDDLVWFEVLHAARMLALISAGSSARSESSRSVAEAWAPARRSLVAQIRGATGLALV